MYFKWKFHWFSAIFEIIIIDQKIHWGGGGGGGEQLYGRPQTSSNHSFILLYLFYIYIYLFIYIYIYI